MGNEETIEEMRRELGKEAKQKGEPLHEGASEEFVRGYQSAKGFGSNVTPRYFGRTGVGPEDWTCICGTLNKGTVRRKVGGRWVCWTCGIEKELAEQAKD